MDALTATRVAACECDATCSTGSPDGDLGACEASLGRVQRSIAQLEPRYLEKASAKSLFEDRRTPNRAAIEALTPALDRVLRRGVDFTIECRSLACRVYVMDEPTSRQVWGGPLRDDFPLPKP